MAHSDQKRVDAAIVALFLPMHYIGLTGVPRRYYEMGDMAFIPDSIHTLNAFMSVMAFIVGAAQILFAYNIYRSVSKGKLSGPNPWNANSLEWQTPETPPGHGNFGPELPVVYRWPYDYSVPGASRDFIPQTEPAPSGTGSKAHP